MCVFSSHATRLISVLDIAVGMPSLSLPNKSRRAGEEEVSHFSFAEGQCERSAAIAKKKFYWGRVREKKV